MEVFFEPCTSNEGEIAGAVALNIKLIIYKIF